MSPISGLNLEKLLNISNYACEHDVGIIIYIFLRVLLFANTSKSTRKSVHGTRLCGVAQRQHITIILGICGLG